MYFIYLFYITLSDECDHFFLCKSCRHYYDSFDNSVLKQIWYKA